MDKNSKWQEGDELFWVFMLRVIVALSAIGYAIISILLLGGSSWLTG